MNRGVGSGVGEVANLDLTSSSTIFANCSKIDCPTEKILEDTFDNFMMPFNWPIKMQELKRRICQAPRSRSDN